jgi:hypothetical protein
MNHVLIQIINYLILKKLQDIIIIIFNDVKLYFTFFSFLKVKKKKLVKFLI